MNPQLDSNLRRIERFSVVLRGFCTGLLVFIGVVAVVAAAAVFAGRVTSVNSFGQSIPLADLTPRTRTLLAFVGLVTAVVIVKALYHLRRLLDNYSRREVFTTESARQIRQFGLSCMLWGALKIVWAFLPMLLLTETSRAVGITIDSLAIGAVIVVISWFAEMATTLREENDLTI